MVITPRGIRHPSRYLRELSRRRALWVPHTNCVPLSVQSTDPYEAKGTSSRHSMGICNVMENDDAGLPSSSVYRVLISTWLSSRSRRGHSSGECRERTMEGAGYGGVQFPSWSWCGWTSDALESPLGKKSEYKALMVNGCLPDVYEWLMKHTWIHWYIRDDYGNLRPSWHRKKSKADESSEKRWKGDESLEMNQICDGHHRGRSLVRLGY